MEVIDRIARKAPDWYAHIDAGVPGPPTPPDGWGRWWDRYGDLIIVFAALTLISAVIDKVVTNDATDR